MAPKGLFFRSIQIFTPQYLIITSRHVISLCGTKLYVQRLSKTLYVKSYQFQVINPTPKTKHPRSTSKAVHRSYDKKNIKFEAKET